MKNQYFGDKRDYFKWNLISALAETQVNNRSLMYLPMLTPNDSTQEGLFTVYLIGKGDKRIHDYLCDCLSKGYRNIKALRKMFIELGIKFEQYWDNKYFTESKRTKYLTDIPFTAWQDDLVFIDPDVGIEPKSHSSMIKNGIEKYLLWTDLEVIRSRLGANTTLLIYQHLQFNANKVPSDLNYRCKRLQEIWPDKAVDYIRDKDVAFITVHSNDDVTACLNNLAHLYDLRTRSDDISYVMPEISSKKSHKPRKNDSALTTDLIHDINGLTVQEVVNRRVLCPACRDKVFARWPLGWDSHAERCKGIDEINSDDKKKFFKAKYRHLFR